MDQAGNGSSEGKGISRRSFLKFAGIGAVAAGAGVTAIGAGCTQDTGASEQGPMESSGQGAAGTAQGQQAQQAPTGSIAEFADTKYKIVDNHLHFLDFIQRSDGVEALISKMNEAGVTDAVVFGIPMAKQYDEDANQEPAYYLSNDSRTYYYPATDFLFMEALQKANADDRARIHPFVCGINPNDRFAAEHIQQVFDLYPGQFAGIGELMSRHDDLTALTYGEPPHLDHPAFLEIFDMAAEGGYPVLIHHNISAAYAQDAVYRDELEAGLAHNRNSKIIWAHAGVSRRIEVTGLAQIVDDLMQTHSNLWADLSWVCWDEYIDVSSESRAEWAALLDKYPDRFMIGSDLVGHWGSYVETITRYHSLLDLLKPETASKVASENVLGLLRPV
jgi:hypothetical protein